MSPTPLDLALDAKRPNIVRHVAGPPVGSTQRCVECKIIIADWSECGCGSVMCESSARWEVGGPVGQAGVALYAVEGPNAQAYLPSVPCAGVN